jgi:hypothetical protein
MQGLTAKLSVFFTLLMALSLIISSCSTSEYASKEVRENLGRTTDNDILIKVPNLFNRHNFQIYRHEETLDGITFESEWKERSVFDDERALGVERARNKIYVSSRPATARATNLHRVWFEGINEVFIQGSDRWTDTLMTDMAEKYLNDLVQDYKDDLAVGVRRN